MITRLTLFIITILLIVPACLCSGRGNDTAFYVKLTAIADNAPSDVYKASLTGSDAVLFISHSGLPKGFYGRIEKVVPSSLDSRLLIKESECHIFKSKSTGVIRTVYGSSFSMSGDDQLVKHTAVRYWLGNYHIFKKAPMNSVNEQVDSVAWSPNAKKILAHIIDYKNGRDMLRVWDVETGIVRSLYKMRGSALAYWMPVSVSVLVVEPTEGITTRFVSVSPGGKARLLFYYTGHVSAAAVSLDSRQIAFGDPNGFYIYRNRKLNKLYSIILDDGMSISRETLSFSNDTRTLAALYAASSSSLHTFIREKLLTIDTHTAQSLPVTEWEVTLGNSPGEDSTHNLIGWNSEQNGLFVISECCTIEGPDTEWRKLWIVPINPNTTPRLLTDTGPRGIDLAL